MTQFGRGYPIFQEERRVPVLNQEQVKYDDAGGVTIQTLNKSFQRKHVREIVIDLTDAFTDQEYGYQGTILWWTVASAAAGTLYVRFGSRDEGRLPLQFDRGISGIPFDRFFLTNPLALPGVTITLTVIMDTPDDRVGVTG